MRWRNFHQIHPLLVATWLAACSPAPHAESELRDAADATLSAQAPLASVETSSPTPERDASLDSPASVDAAPPTSSVVLEERDPLLDSPDAQGCERQVAFSAVTLDDPTPFDVIIVADHSGSISWSRDDLATGLAGLLDDIEGRDARFFVLTPTQYGADSAAFEQALGFTRFDYQDPATETAYEPAMTRYTQSCTAVDGAAMDCPVRGVDAQVEFDLVGNFAFAMPQAAAAIRRDMDRSQVQKQQDRIVDAVLALGTHGSPNEQPLCTLARYINQPAEELPEHAVFVVLSDEDDQSLASDCLAGYDANLRLIPTQPSGPCENCDVARAYASALVAQPRIEFRCVPTNDQGQLQPELAVESVSYLNVKPECAPNGNCDAEQLFIVQQTCAPTDVIERCDSICEVKPTGCILDLPQEQTEVCDSPFTFEDAEYANFIDYCNQKYAWGNFENCVVSIEHVTSESASNIQDVQLRPRPLLTGASSGASALGAEFRAKADGLIGSDNYFVETIQFDPAFACELSPGQSYAPTLREIATSAEDVFPICEDYAPALGRIDAFAHQLLRTEYALELRPTETVQGVLVTNAAGQQRALAGSDFSFDEQTQHLHLEDGALDATDRELSVELEVHCQRVR